MVHPNLLDRNEAINFCRNVLTNKSDFLILDTETTGLGEKDVIIQIAVIDLDGNTLIDTLVRPTKRKSIPREATAIHGIKFMHLADAPTFVDVLDDLYNFVKSGKKFLIFNFAFDARLINQTLTADSIGTTFNLKGNCIMQIYSQFVGNWNSISNEYKYQKLPESNHSALADCHATLRLIRQLAEQPLSDIPSGYVPTAVKPTPGMSTLIGCLILILILLVMFKIMCN
jgi:DNA polymerase-3 subunit epsilon